MRGKQRIDERRDEDMRADQAGPPADHIRGYEGLVNDLRGGKEPSDKALSEEPRNRLALTTESQSAARLIFGFKAAHGDKPSPILVGELEHEVRPHGRVRLAQDSRLIERGDVSQFRSGVTLLLECFLEPLPDACLVVHKERYRRPLAPISDIDRLRLEWIRQRHDGTLRLVNEGEARPDKINAGCARSAIELLKIALRPSSCPVEDNSLKAEALGDGK